MDDHFLLGIDLCKHVVLHGHRLRRGGRDRDASPADVGFYQPGLFKAKPKLAVRVSEYVLG